MKHLLENYQQQRFNWAFEAKEDYLSQFKIFEAEDKQVNTRKLIISVYGPTQVGKSTLILKLLGVKTAYLTAVSKFLRGKRAIGESSTVTVTTYQVSPTDEYQIKLPNRDVVAVADEQQLEALLAQLRMDVEQGLIQSVDPVQIAIPNYMVTQQEQSLEIIDLPGIESAEDREVAHVERCLSYWVPNSHVCLIVNSANDLTFVRDMEMPQLSQWYEYEQNYFLILTRALTPDSVKKALPHFQQPDDFITYYKDQLERIVYHRKGTIFPVEIGHSYEMLDEEAQHFADEMIVRLRQKLNGIDIQQISFNYLSGYYRDVLKQSKAELETIEQQMAAQQNEIAVLEMNQKMLTKQRNDKLKAEESTLAILREKIAAFRANPLRMKLYINELEQSFQEAEVTKHASGANTFISNEAAKLKEMIDVNVKEKNQLLKGIQQTLLLKYLKPVPYADITFTDWDTPKVDQYLIKANYLKKKQRMVEQLKELVEDEVKKIQRHISKQTNLLERAEADLLAEIKRAQTNIDIEMKHYTSMIEAHEKELSTLQAYLKDAQEMWEKDKSHALKYKRYFIQHFLKRKQALLEMATADDIEHRYMAAMFLRVLGEDAQKIIGSMELEMSDEDTVQS